MEAFFHKHYHNTALDPSTTASFRQERKDPINEFACKDRTQYSLEGIHMTRKNQDDTAWSRSDCHNQELYKEFRKMKDRY